MPRSSCVSHPSWDFFLPIRQAYVVLCDGDHCGAGLIATFEYFTNCLKDTSQVLWIYKTHQALSEQMLGLYSIRSIQEALHTLEAAGIIMTRAPKKGLTGHFGTTSYLFNYETVSEMMKQGQTAAGKIADGPYAKLPTDAGKIADGPYAKLPTVEGGVNNIGSIEVELENPNGGEVLNSESDTNTKTENPPARAALHRSQRLKVTRADLDLGYTVKAYTKNLYRRERGIGFKLLANELREFERLERAEGNWRIRAALVGYLRDDDQANIDSNWEMGYFLKHWELSDASLDAMADMEAMMRESRIAEADSGQGAISTGGDGMQIPPDSAKGLKRPRALYQWYVDRWNELAPSARVKSAEAYRHEEAFQDNDLVGFWDDVCERVEQEYRIAEKNPGFWLTLDWILSNKNGRPNWRGLLARKPKMKESDVIGEALFGRQS